jgi:hypothetical protein
MKQKYRCQLAKTENGQSIVLFALLFVGILGIVALAVDGGYALNERRKTQNAADSSSMTGIQYVITADIPAESVLQVKINQIGESYGIPDSDGIPGNETNANISIFYTDQRGVFLTGCFEAPCGAIPLPTRGVRVEVANQVETFFAPVIGIDQIDIGADAIAVVGSDVSNEIDDAVLIALGNCDASDLPFFIDDDSNKIEVLGGTFSNSWFENSGNNNHFHGQVYYGDGNIAGPSDGTIDYEPAAPTTATTAIADPIGLELADFAPGGIYATSVVTYYNVSTAPGTVDLNYLRSVGLYNESTKTIATGLYYAGNKPIFIDGVGTNGVITLVTGNTIRMEDPKQQVSAYLDNPGLLLFSAKTFSAADQCSPEDNTAIYLTHNAVGNAPFVDHNPPCPYDLDTDPGTTCYSTGRSVVTGLIYAPFGRVWVSGNNTTFKDGIISWAITIEGNRYIFVYNAGLIEGTGFRLSLQG